MMKLHIFGILEVGIYHQCTNGSPYPDMSFMVSCNKTGFVAIVNGISFQIITVVHKNFLSTLVTCHIVYSTGKSSYPDTSVAIFIYTVNIVVTQTINILFLMLITSQFIVRSIFLLLGFHQTIPFRCNPKILFAILQNEIYITTQWCTTVRHCTIFSQITFIYTILIIYS